MIDLLSTSQVLLKDAGYTVRLANVRGETVICFEDDAVVGFCVTFTNPNELIANWHAFESEIVTTFAANFRAAGDKAWNVYCVFLTDLAATDVQSREISWVEENLERTRKLAASGISSREDVLRVLLPILPIQFQPVLLNSDVTERLRRRIADIAPTAKDVALDSNIRASDVVALLGSRT